MDKGEKMEKMAEKLSGPASRSRIWGGLAATAPSSRRMVSMSYMAAPNHTKKVPELKVVKPTRITPTKRWQQLDQEQKQREELAALQEKLSGLQRKLNENDEALSWEAREAQELGAIRN